MFDEQSSLGDRSETTISTNESAFNHPTPGPEKRTVAQVMGEIVWLFSQSPQHKNFFIADLEWLVMTPILLNQFRIFYAPDRPIGVAFWAYVNERVDERLSGGNARLAPADWKSGDILWLVDIVAPYGGQEEMIKDLKVKVFPEREIKALGLENNQLTIKTY
jgi:cytolysin-activating lysine-acyltransferase